MAYSPTANTIGRNCLIATPWRRFTTDVRQYNEGHASSGSEPQRLTRSVTEREYANDSSRLGVSSCSDRDGLL